jgi:small subunit ribosomal protein S8
MMTDPISDMLTRIRNANRVGYKKVAIPTSKMKVQIAEILETEGYIESVEKSEEGREFTVTLKYKNGQRVICDLQKVSKPSLKTYVGKADIPRVRDGLGISILSTSQGLMTGKQARKLGIGGEVVCKVW